MLFLKSIFSHINCSSTGATKASFLHPFRALKSTCTCACAQYGFATKRCHPVPNVWVNCCHTTRFRKTVIRAEALYAEVIKSLNSKHFHDFWSQILMKNTKSINMHLKKLTWSRVRQQLTIPPTGCVSCNDSFKLFSSISFAVIDSSCNKRNGICMHVH